MLIANNIQGKYLEYKGKPLVRQDNEIIYGDMSGEYYVYMMIMTYKSADKTSVDIPDRIMVQLIPTKGTNPSPVKQRQAIGLHDAFETACAWLPN